MYGTHTIIYNPSPGSGKLTLVAIGKLASALHGRLDLVDTPSLLINDIMSH